MQDIVSLWVMDSVLGLDNDKKEVLFGIEQSFFQLNFSETVKFHTRIFRFDIKMCGNIK